VKPAAGLRFRCLEMVLGRTAKNWWNLFLVFRLKWNAH
jgi:hypothetical protein